MRLSLLCAALIGLLGAVETPHAAPGRALSDADLSRVQFEQKLNNQVSLDLSFRDEAGKTVRLGDYFGRKPIILVLGYYGCPMLCTLVANGLVESLEDLKWSIGREFDVVHVSIDPKESPDVAAAKKRTCLKRYGRPGAGEGWNFLTGDETSIRQLTRQVGFEYAYDPPSHQYAHASGLIILTPQGKVSHYLFGVTYAPADIYQALAEASASKVGSPVQRLLLLCFHYNPVTGKYSATILDIIRLLGAGTVLGILALIASLTRRSPRAPLGQVLPPASPPLQPSAKP